MLGKSYAMQDVPRKQLMSKLNAFCRLFPVVSCPRGTSNLPSLYVEQRAFIYNQALNLGFIIYLYASSES